MSKTTKTRPLRVRMHNPLDIKVGRSEVHDHSGGTCTLPAPDAPPVTLLWPGEPHCYWGFEYRGVNVCGDPICTAHDERRIERRRARHEARVELHKITVGVLEAA